MDSQSKWTKFWEPVTINYKIGQVWYGEVAVPFYPASGDYTTFQNNLTLDIDYGYPLQGDAEENHNGPRLVGHPNPALYHPIYHWFAIYGTHRPVRTVAMLTPFMALRRSLGTSRLRVRPQP